MSPETTPFRVYQLGCCILVFAIQTAHSASAAELTAGELAFNRLAKRDCRMIRLWPDGKTLDGPQTSRPETVQTKNGVTLLKNVTTPSVMLLPADKKDNTGVLLVVCPGGGYQSLYTDAVIDTAEWANQRGINVALLKYRIPQRDKPVDWNHQPLQDAQRALSILRSRAAEFGVKPDRIGISGYSAGGHLAASLAIRHATRAYKPIDQFDAVSCRPDFCSLMYPAYLTKPIDTRTRDESVHFGLISEEATPPTFISVSRQDQFAIGSVEMQLALMKARVSSELHVYPVGVHGGTTKRYPYREWTNEFHRFLIDHQFVAGGQKPEPATYKAKGLPDVQPSTTLTLGDRRLRQIFGGQNPVLTVWPNKTGPQTEDRPGSSELVSAKSRGGKALNITNVTQPTLTVVAPKSKPNGRAVIVCPGGAYQGLAAEHEGVAICQWLNRLGITGILLKYRVHRPKNQPKHANALQDVQRSIRLIRSKAKELKIEPDQIGVCGFSAGGHLCTTLSTNFATDSYAPIDDVDTLSARPDFAILVYPAYLTDPVNSDKVDSLLANLDAKQTPPMFMTSARDDKFTRGMLNFFLKAREADVLAECHVYATGGHGGGLDPNAYPSSEWTKACERWMRDLKILPAE